MPFRSTRHVDFLVQSRLLFRIEYSLITSANVPATKIKSGLIGVTHE
jgi:hypothetical protein